MKKLAIVQKIKSVEPVEGDDSIERVCAPGFQCMAIRGEFKDGDMCIYFVKSNTVLPAKDALLMRGTTLAKSLAGIIEDNPIVTIGMDVTEILGLEDD